MYGSRFEKKCSSCELVEEAAVVGYSEDALPEAPERIVDFPRGWALQAQGLNWDKGGLTALIS